MATRVSFMSLPAELRNQIYDLVGLVHNTRIWISSPNQRKAQVKEPIIALANRQIRSEVLGIFYGQNVFACQTREDLKSFLQHLPASSLRALRTIQWGSPNRAVLGRIRNVLVKDLKPFLTNGLGAEVVAASMQVKDEGRLYVTASEIVNFKQSGSGVSRSEIFRVRRE